MCCAGRIESERVGPSERLWVCGAGEIGHALAPLARGLGFEVVIADARAALNDATRFPSARRELRDGEELVQQVALGARDWLLIATDDDALDERIVERALAGGARYVGLVGSRRKVFRLLERIAQRRGSALPLDRLYAPAGVQLGARSSAELAISIAAELIALRRGAAVPPVRAVADAACVRRLASRVARGHSLPERG